MSKHTPGPWRVWNGSDTTPEATVSTIINEQPEGWAHHIALIFNDSTREANANLIAAAPEMYEALLALFKVSAVYGAMPSKLLIQIENAISKAEGKPPLLKPEESVTEPALPGALTT